MKQIIHERHIFVYGTDDIIFSVKENQGVIIMKCAIFFAEGFEECEGLITVDMLRRGGVHIDTVSVSEDKAVRGSHGITVLADLAFSEFDPAGYEVLILPGGRVGTQNLEKCTELKDSLKKHFESGKLTCAICAAPSVYGHMGMLKGRHYTCFPTFDEAAFGGTYEAVPAVTDGNLITGRGMGATIEFSEEILRQLTDEETLKSVRNGMQYFGN